MAEPSPPSTEGGRILVVDDDAPIRRLLQRFLSGNGFAVETASDAGQAERALSAAAYDLMVLDIMMPDESGMELLARLKGRHNLPVLLYSALEEADMRITGFKLGADDYLIKSAPPEELLLRIRAILRRVREGKASAPQPGAAPGASPAPGATPAPGAAPASDPTLAGFSFDPERGRLSRGDERFTLPESQARLLAVLFARPEAVLSREDLARALADRAQGAQGTEAAIHPRSVDAQISRLRATLADIDRPLAKSLQTLRGRGYRLLLD